ncbi:uncharacterized protein LOC129047764 [Pongo abelii]|uniref:uncharacterized protein LOC129047764 n=1 Tax=Pongo abelii TaxID=9601 RepID=UPI0023E8A7AE|nr:uncharacterized protein LOC129047764 [Pongo abelii]
MKNSLHGLEEREDPWQRAEQRIKGEEVDTGDNSLKSASVKDSRELDQLQEKARPSARGRGCRGAGLRVTSPPCRPAPSPLRGLVKSRALAAAVDRAALLGWLRVPWPWALCAASPGGGRAIIAQRRSTYLGRLCKARGGRPGGGSHASAARHARGRGRARVPGGASSCSRCGRRPILQERAAARHRWGWGDPRSHPAWPPAGLFGNLHFLPPAARGTMWLVLDNEM